MEFAAGQQNNCIATELLTAIAMKITISGHVRSCTVVERYQNFSIFMVEDTSFFVP
jgi:hypothetical protein